MLYSQLLDPMDRASFRLFSFTLIPILLYLPFIPQATAADLDSDKQALMDFATSVNHGRKLNWNSSDVCTSWIGVTCSEHGKRVIALRLPGHGLTGPIPQDTLGKLDALEVLSLRSNLLVGNIPTKLSSLPALRRLYLQNNSFNGSVPNFLSSNLTAIDLSFNFFGGQIPTSFENLTQLVLLNLQSNSFTGSIPDLNLPKLKHLNLSYNNFSGPIPSSLQEFPDSSFIGNPHSCGGPLARCSPIIPSLPPSPSVQPPPPPISSKIPRRKPSIRTSIGIGAGGLAFLILFALAFLCCKYEKKGLEGSGPSRTKGPLGGRSEKTAEQYGSGAQEAERNKLYFFEGCTYNFDLEDLLRASAEVLGKGSYGTVYKAALDDGTTVMVKRLKEVLVGKREFEQQMEIIGSITHHGNVLPLRAFYYSKDEKLMVYDYISGGSLCNALHGDNGSDNTPLDWEARLKVAVEAARGIAHIHTEAGGKLTHGNIKSSNVLLSQDLTAYIADFGMAPIVNAPTSSRHMVGYRAPEQINHHKTTQKSDVYSFGVLLLEMLTGKAPLRSPRNDDLMDLPRWVQSVVREEWTAEVFDAELMRQPDVEEEMVQMLQIAMACVVKLPDQRPSMVDVVRMVEEIRQRNDGSGDRTSSEDRSKDSNVTPTVEE